MIQFRYSGRAWKGTLAEFIASTKKWRLGDQLLPTDSAEVRIGNGVDVFDDLVSMPAGAKADNILAIGAPSAFTAVGGTFADLAAARTGANQLRTDALAGLTATNAKIDALLVALKAGNLAKTVAAIGAPTPFTTIGGTFADLAAARTGVNTLRTDSLAGLTATNAKLDALLAALKVDNVMIADS